VKNDLDLIWSALQLAITDTHYGTASPAYKTFFKDNIYAHFVAEIFKNITTGASISKSNRHTPVSPSITCLTTPGIAIENTIAGPRDLYQICVHQPNRAGFYSYGTDWIFLCPSFFRLESQPSIPLPGQTSPCPIFSNGQYQPHWSRLVVNQMYILMHEILHFYLDNAPGPVGDVMTEINEINAAVRLGTGATVSNAQSYVFYAASK